MISLLAIVEAGSALELGGMMKLREIIVIRTGVGFDDTVREKNERGNNSAAGRFVPRKIEKEHFRNALSERISSAFKGRTEEGVLQEERKPRNHSEAGAKSSSGRVGPLYAVLYRRSGGEGAELACIKCGRRGWLCEG